MDSDQAGHQGVGGEHETSCYSYASGPIEMKPPKRKEVPNHLFDSTSFSPSPPGEGGGFLHY